MPRHQSQPTSTLPPGFVLRYIIGAVIVAGGLIASSIATGHVLATLVSTAKGIPACGAAPGPNCLADYPATVEQKQQSSDSSNVTLVLHTSFLSDTNDSDECFGTACVDLVPISNSASGQLYPPENVRIRAGDGRVVSILTANGSITTQDAPGVAVLDTVADLVGVLYLFALTALFAGGYVVLAISTNLWRIHPIRWLRAVTAAQVLFGVVSVALLIGFAVGGPVGLVILGVVALAGFISSHVARRHVTRASRPYAAMTTSGPTPGELAFANRHWGSLIAALYLLAAFPVPIGIDVTLRLIHDGYNTAGALIPAVIGVALGAFLVFKVDQSMRRSSARSAGTVTN
jgi:hypothetical protein